MSEVPTEETRDGGCGWEFDALAAVVGAGKTRSAGMARDVGFDGDLVTWLKVFDGRVNGDDLFQDTDRSGI